MEWVGHFEGDPTMNRAKALLGTVAATILLCWTAPAGAQLTEFVWDNTKTGAQAWQQSGNWTPSGFPNDPLHAANLSVPLGADLNVSIGSGVTVAGVTLGGAAGAQTTEISAGPGGILTLRNDSEPPMLTGNADFNGNNFVNGTDFLIWQRGLGMTGQEDNENGDADASTVVDAADLQIWKDQFGRGSEAFAVTSAFINSIGVAGSTNTISAAIHSDNEQIEIAGPTSLTISGPFTYAGDPDNAGISAAALRVVDPRTVVTMTGGITMNNADGDEAVDFRFNDVERSQGRLVINGIISGTADVTIGVASNAARMPLSTVELNGNNTFTGSIRAGRGNIVLGHNNALGVPGGTYRQAGPANQFGYNLLSSDDSRVIQNAMVIAQWQSFRGDHSLEWAGEIEQTNNRGIVNLLAEGKSLTFSGRLNIFEDAELDVVRELEFDGTGLTRITGSIRDVPDDATLTPQDHRIRKTGTGVLVIDVAAGDNTHIGPAIVDMGNLHYANNDSLNVGGGLIRARGGAVGVDTGVSNNAALMAQIDPESRGGLMLAASDAAANLDFTSTLANAANMTVAAPETGLTFTGSITPANSRYQLGGGTGTLTLPGAQLSGGNSVEVRNGGTVELLGDNTYTGSTTLLTKYTTTHQAQAAADSTAGNLSVGPNFYRQVAPTLVVDKLADGGQPSGIGSAAVDAANLFIQAGTLKYVGAGDSTNRLFTVGTGGATIDSSGTGPVSFTNSGPLGLDDAEDRMGTLDDFTLNRAPNAIYDVDDTSDVIVGMTVTDPDPGGTPFSNQPRIPDGTTVTGINDDGTEIGLSSNYGFILKADTRIVFGTVPRTLTLTGSNTDANSLASVISDSARGGVVNVDKTGAGTWVLAGANTYSGTTTVSEGTLLVNGMQTGDGETIVDASATLGGTGTLGGSLAVEGIVAPGQDGVGTLNIAGGAEFGAGATGLIQIGGIAAGQFDELVIDGELVAGGTFDIDLTGGFNPAAGNSFDILDFTTASGTFALSLPPLSGGLAWNAASLLTNGTISVVSALAAVPEPSAAALGLSAALAVPAMRRRRRGLNRFC
jgi:autotransporter-associated beta strand protein